jgi:hypothetical protein
MMGDIGLKEAFQPYIIAGIILVIIWFRNRR